MYLQTKKATNSSQLLLRDQRLCHSKARVRRGRSMSLQ